MFVCVALGLVVAGVGIGLVLLLLFTPSPSCYKFRPVEGRWEGGDVSRPPTSMGGLDHHHHDVVTGRGAGAAGDDLQPHDMVMPGFRFHPSEEELIEFYLRRKVEGKRFNLELIADVQLYRYDPWDLPAQASIGDKEWFFYVPRDRKYRNGDRPNRVTPSGYWKATGADRMVRVDAGSRNIGLKKTLVFYVGKAPKGIRSSWIMNEYRLPHGDADRYQRVQEISLCRVYKRPGIDDNFHLTTTKSSGSKAAAAMNRKHSTAASRTSAAPRLAPLMFSEGTNTAMSLSAGAAPTLPPPAATAAAMFRSTASGSSPRSTTSTEEDGGPLYHLKGLNPMQQLPSSTHALLNANSSTMATIPIDELSRAISIGSYGQAANPSQPMPPSQGSSLLAFPSMEKIWDWNPILESPKVCTSFK